MKLAATLLVIACINGQIAFGQSGPGAAEAQASSPEATQAAEEPKAQNTIYLPPATTVFGLQEAFPAHNALLADFKRAMAASDYATMETISSNAVSFFPRDPIWRYNLACAKTRLGQIPEARTALLAAAILGFSDADGAEADTDLALLRRDPAFQRALTIIRSNHEHPETVPGTPHPLAVELTAPITTSNTVWNMEAGGFSTLFTPRSPSVLYAPRSTAIPGKTGAAINAWLSEGTASGNAGDLYDNHDRGHSKLDVTPFTGLTPTTHCSESRDAGTDTGVSLFNFPGRIAIGNSSTANTSGPLWGSCARRLQNEFPHILLQQYLSNTTYVYPQHHDYLPSIHGDVFPSRTPYLFIAPGSSWTDRPILACLATALAAFRPETKDALAAHGHIAPTLQYLLRMAQTNVVRRADYLTPAAHPVIFNGKAIDTLRLAMLAHSIETNALPPIAPLRILADESASFVPGRDYDDKRGERIFDSPFAIARVWRAKPDSRKMVVSALFPENNKDLVFHWFVGQGDQDKIAIRELAPNGRMVEIDIKRHESPFATPFGVESCRADVICVADDGVNFSPPSFITWYFPPTGEGAYADPALTAK